LKQRIKSIESQTQTLTNKLDEIVSGINALNINVAKLTERMKMEK
jgi:prefoldin subunit 5